MLYYILSSHARRADFQFRRSDINKFDISRFHFANARLIDPTGVCICFNEELVNGNHGRNPLILFCDLRDHRVYPDVMPCNLCTQITHASTADLRTIFLISKGLTRAEP